MKPKTLTDLEIAIKLEKIEREETMKQTAMQQAILLVRNRIESMNETLMCKHTAHYLQQVERDLHLLLKYEKEQIEDAFLDGYKSHPYLAEQYYTENYGKDA